ncbi:acyl carrier protein [Thermomonospora amylolytica]|uniref:acyl carrier protein n=1 Tax=Thermomonospora amylolytica TaxID=1411117 RepID=UPI000E6BD3E3|nr:acyl carrier protein [Thermomonospora amylolytica]
MTVSTGRPDAATIQELLIRAVTDETERSAAAPPIDPEEDSFQDLGLDSLGAVNVAKRMEADLGVPVPPCCSSTTRRSTRSPGTWPTRADPPQPQGARRHRPPRPLSVLVGSCRFAVPYGQSTTSSWAIMPIVEWSIRWQW